MTSSTGMSRRPPGPETVATAPAAMRAGTLSAAGEPLQRLPPMVARPWIWVEPMRFAASITPGHTCLSRGCSFSSAPVTAAPIRQPPFSSRDRAGLGDLLDVDDQLRVDDVGAHLDQEVGPPGQHADIAGRPREQGDRPVQRLWRFVSHGGGLAFRIGRLERPVLARSRPPAGRMPAFMHRPGPTVQPLCSRRQHRPASVPCQWDSPAVLPRA